MLWGLSALVAALLMAAWRLVDLLFAGSVSTSREQFVGAFLVGLVLLSAAGAMALIRPHAGLPRINVLLARLGVLGYIPFAAVILWIHVIVDPTIESPYGAAQVVSTERVILRIVAAVILGLILLALRPNGRVLASRSMLMRTGQVDRQTMRALASALLLPLAGDLAELGSVATAGRLSDGLHTAGSFMILIGSALFVLGLIGVVIDCIRLVPVVVGPPLSIESITKAEGPNA